MRPILLVRNDRYESFGVAPSALAQAGADLRTVDATHPHAEFPAPGDIAGVIAFGGTVNVDQHDEHPYLAQVRDYTTAAIEAGVPYLGICLGSQILAWASGREVYRGSVKEVGFEPVSPTAEASQDALLSSLAPREMVLQWHEDTYDLPEGATLLVTGDRIPVQAYRIGETTWGIQFHLEVDDWELGWWLDVADAEVDLEGVWGKSAAQIRAEAGVHMGRQHERAREIFNRFARIAQEADG